ncbi:MAG: alpha/beta fold hydrolase [Lachnospiraceae bacterium]|nr:alpha/beta fold hydrolase [Lachnospiraceae bacterium]
MKKTIALLTAAGMMLTAISPVMAADSAVESAVSEVEAVAAEESGILNESTDAYEESYVLIPSEDGRYDIPAIINVPTGEIKGAVVMLHGTGSTKNEAGDGYKTAAPVLSEKYGIATVRIDFTGYGDSEADDKLYDFSSAVNDAVSARNYVAANYDVDKFAVMGWSQGGTDALLSAGKLPELWDAVVTWAGAPDLSDMLSDEDYAEAQENGFFEMEYDFRGPSEVSLQWCEDVKNTDVLDVFSAYAGPVLAIYGTQDDTVDPVWSDRIVETSTNKDSATYPIEGMDHTFNVFSEEDLHSLHDAIDATGSFLAAEFSVSADSAAESVVESAAESVEG